MQYRRNANSAKNPSHSCSDCYKTLTLYGKLYLNTFYIFLTVFQYSQYYFNKFWLHISVFVIYFSIDMKLA